MTELTSAAVTQSGSRVIAAVAETTNDLVVVVVRCVMAEPTTVTYLGASASLRSFDRVVGQLQEELASGAHDIEVYLAAYSYAEAENESDQAD